MFKALVGGHAHSRDRPAPEIPELGFCALPLHFTELRAAGVGSCDERAYARATDHVDGNIVGLKHTQHANVRDAAGESSTERDAYAWAAIVARVRERPQRANCPPQYIGRIAPRQFGHFYVFGVVCHSSPVSWRAFNIYGA